MFGNPFPIILKYGRVYPLAEGVTLEDSATIKRTATGLGDAFLAEPIKGRGHQLPAASNDLRETLKVAKRESLYVSIYVYPDSHDVSGAVYLAQKLKCSRVLSIILECCNGKVEIGIGL